MTREVWMDIPGYERLYKICSIGNKIISYSRYKKRELMKIQKNRDGYLVVNLSKFNKEKCFRINRLKAIVFIPNPDNKEYVNHIDGIKENNELWNLEWCTAKENIRHAINTGLLKEENNYFIRNNPCKGKFGENSHSSKRVLQFSKYGEFIKEWGSMVDVERALGIPKQCISNCCSGRCKTTFNFIFKLK